MLNLISTIYPCRGLALITNMFYAMHKNLCLKTYPPFLPTIPFPKPVFINSQSIVSAFKLLSVRSSVLYCFSYYVWWKKPFKPWDSPVLERRLPVARRYSNALVTSAVMLNALIKLSAFMLISAFSVLFSKTNLTDCSQFSSLSYGLKVRGLNWKLENRDSNYECLICYACYRSLLKSAGWTTFSKVEAFWPYFLHWLYCI